jgi:hypothetical protein
MNKLLPSVLLILAVTVQTARATPSSIVRVPSSDVQPYATFHLGIDNNTTMFVPKDNDGHALPVTYGLTVGLFSFPLMQVEAGIDVREPTDKPLTWNFKLVMPEGAEQAAMPALVIGVFDMGTASGENDFNIFYGEVAKTISFLGRFTFGYFVGNASHLKNGRGEKDSNAIIMGFDRRLPEINDRLWFGIDYMGTRSDYGAVSFGFSWSFSENASLLLGYIRYNEEVEKGVAGRAFPRKNLVTWQADFDF